MKKLFFIIPLFVILIFFISCVCNCDNEMDSKRKEYGNPEEVDSYTESGYHSETWWYWSKGISFTFTWGEGVEGCCKVSTYTFSPIPADSSWEVKEKIRSLKKPTNVEIDWRNSIFDKK